MQVRLTGFQASDVPFVGRSWWRSWLIHWPSVQRRSPFKEFLSSLSQVYTSQGLCWSRAKPIPVKCYTGQRPYRSTSIPIKDYISQRLYWSNFILVKVFTSQSLYQSRCIPVRVYTVQSLYWSKSILVKDYTGQSLYRSMSIPIKVYSSQNLYSPVCLPTLYYSLDSPARIVTCNVLLNYQQSQSDEKSWC